MNFALSRPIGLFLALLGLLVACSKKTPEAAAPTPQPSASVSRAAGTNLRPEDSSAGAYACRLLMPEEIAAVQGEPFKSTKASSASQPGLSISQCYFELPTAVNSVVLTVTRKGDDSDARDPKESWQEIFHREQPPEKDDKDGESKQPDKIDGLGDEAFWTGTRVGGALYVLKGNVYIRISVGGAGDQAEKTKRSRALAESVLKRL
ncbi:MAG: hypothetical protein ACJ8M4_00425 [Chthoniobacterales bacterium]